MPTTRLAKRALRGLSLAAAVLAAASPAAAETEWQTYGSGQQGDRGAAICPLDGGGADGRVFCFSFGCTDTEPLRFVVSVIGMRLPDGPADLAVSVDGAPAGSLAMRPIGEPGFAELAAPWSPGEHAALLSALRRGQQAVLSLPDGSALPDQTLSLDGSARTLAAAREACPAPSGDGPREVQRPPRRAG